MIVVSVHGGNGDRAAKELKRKMQRELVFRNLKMLKAHEPPSVKKVRKQQESERRRRKLIRKRIMES